MLLVGCATLPAELPLGPSGYAPVPQPGGPLADAEATLQARIGAERSGFHLLGVNEDSLRWRLALIDSAQHSLDLQYYVWWGDESGSLLLSRVVAAADRGVKVRIIVDDLTTNILVVAAPERPGDTPTAAIATPPTHHLRALNPSPHPTPQ